MCGGPEQSKTVSTQSPNTEESRLNQKDMNQLTCATEDSFYNLLELASDNDVEGSKHLIDYDVSSINRTGLWFVRRKGSTQVIHEHRTPLMVASTYGSVDVLKFILSHPESDVNISCGLDKSTALHCAASGGSINAVEVVTLLLSAGADPNCVDANGDHPIDVICVHPKLQNMRVILEDLLKMNAFKGSFDIPCLSSSIEISNTLTPMVQSLISSHNDMPSPQELLSPALKFADGPVDSTVEKKEYPVDPSLPDIKNSIYATDEFRMFSFKVKPCSRAYSHDWTECPFVHPGENARRRDPRKYHYSCVPCPDFKKGSCRRGDMCEYAHGVFESWLHPAQYRTRLCKDGTSCNRRVCFFAHTVEELRPLYASTGSAMLSPRSASSASVMDMATAMSLLPGSPSSVSAMPVSPFSQSLSPTTSNMHSLVWPQPNVPTLHLPGSNLQFSRLRCSISARERPPEDLNLMPGFDSQQQCLYDLAGLSQPLSSSLPVSRANRSNILTPSNLEERFSAEFSSPRFSDAAAATVFSPTHKSAVLNQFQQQRSMLSPINTNTYSPKTVEHHPSLHAPFGVPSPGRMSPSMEPISPMGSRLSAFALRERQHQQLRSLSSRDLGQNISASSSVGSPINSWSKLGSLNGTVDWSVNGDELSPLQRSYSLKLENNGGEPDLSWIQSMVKEPPPEMIKEKLTIPVRGAAASGAGLTITNLQLESIDHSILGAWLEKMQLDEIVV